MSDPTQPGAANLDAARMELDRVHRAARDMDAAGVRGGLEAAVAALRGAPGHGELAAMVQQALSNLDSGDLTDMELLVERARRSLAG